MLTEDLQAVLTQFTLELDHKTSDYIGLNFKYDELHSRYCRVSEELEAIKPTVSLLQDMVKKRTFEEENFRKVVLNLAKVLFIQLVANQS